MDIDLKTQLSLLKSLQEIDVLIHQDNQQLQEIPVKVDLAAKEFMAEKAVIDAKQAEKTELEKKRRQDDLELESLIAHTKEREAKLFAIKTNKEYQAATKEIADAKQTNREREEALLLMMEKIDGLAKEITQLLEGIADKEKAFREKETELKKIEAELLGQKASKEAQTKDIVGKIDPKVLREYRFIQQKFPDALALAVAGTCSGCNKRVPPQLYIELQKWQGLISCPNCRRLLFFQEPAENNGSK